MTSPCFGFAKTSLSFKRRGTSQERQGEVRLSPCTRLRLGVQVRVNAMSSLRSLLFELIFNVVSLFLQASYTIFLCHATKKKYARDVKLDLSARSVASIYASAKR
jgi:hypothetical protein